MVTIASQFVASADDESSAAGLMFDIEGTLVDTLPFFYRCYQEVLSEVGGELHWPRFVELTMANVQGPELLMIAAAEQGKELESSSLLALLGQAMLRTMASVPRIIQCIDPTVQIARRAKERGQPIAVVTAGPMAWLDWTLQCAGLSALFSGCVMVTSDVPALASSKRIKTPLDPYIIAAQKLNVGLKHCIGYDDSGVGLAAMAAAGMCAVDVRLLPGYPLHTQAVGLMPNANGGAVTAAAFNAAVGATATALVNQPWLGNGLLAGTEAEAGWLFGQSRQPAPESAGQREAQPFYENVSAVVHGLAKERYSLHSQSVHALQAVSSADVEGAVLWQRQLAGRVAAEDQAAELRRLLMAKEQQAASLRETGSEFKMERDALRDQLDVARQTVATLLAGELAAVTHDLAAANQVKEEPEEDSLPYLLERGPPSPVAEAPGEETPPPEAVPEAAFQESGKQSEQVVEDSEVRKVQSTIADAVEQLERERDELRKEIARIRQGGVAAGSNPNKEWSAALQRKLAEEEAARLAAEGRAASLQDLLMAKEQQAEVLSTNRVEIKRERDLLREELVFARQALLAMQNNEEKLSGEMKPSSANPDGAALQATELAVSLRSTSDLVAEAEQLPKSDVSSADPAKRSRVAQVTASRGQALSTSPKRSQQCQQTAEPTTPLSTEREFSSMRIKVQSVSPTEQSPRVGRMQNMTTNAPLQAGLLGGKHHLARKATPSRRTPSCDLRTKGGAIGVPPVSPPVSKRQINMPCDTQLQRSWSSHVGSKAEEDTGQPYQSLSSVPQAKDTAEVSRQSSCSSIQKTIPPASPRQQTRDTAGVYRQRSCSMSVMAMQPASPRLQTRDTAGVSNQNSCSVPWKSIPPASPGRPNRDTAGVCRQSSCSVSGMAMRPASPGPQTRDTAGVSSQNSCSAPRKIIPPASPRQQTRDTVGVGMQSSRSFPQNAIPPVWPALGAGGAVEVVAQQTAAPTMRPVMPPPAVKGPLSAAGALPRTQVAAAAYGGGTMGAVGAVAAAHMQEHGVEDKLSGSVKFHVQQRGFEDKLSNSSKGCAARLTGSIRGGDGAPGSAGPSLALTPRVVSRHTQISGAEMTAAFKHRGPHAGAATAALVDSEHGR